LFWLGLAWVGFVWFGLVWFGLVWVALIWFGQVWSGLGAGWGNVWTCIMRARTRNPTLSARARPKPLPPQELVWGSAEAPLAVSTLSEPSKPVLFSMARLDRVKNLTGLVDWWGGG
jgi:hypothetical protein